MLALSLIPNGVQTCEYEGPLEAIGSPFIQQFDLTSFPEYVRAAKGFEDQLYISIAADPGITNPAPPGGVPPIFSYDSNGVPVSMGLTFNSTNLAAQIVMTVQSAHTSIR